MKHGLYNTIRNTFKFQQWFKARMCNSYVETFFYPFIEGTGLWGSRDGPWKGFWGSAEGPGD